MQTGGTTTNWLATGLGWRIWAAYRPCRPVV